MTKLFRCPVCKVREGDLHKPGCSYMQRKQLEMSTGPLPVVTRELPEPTVAEVVQRINNGIALGADYNELYDLYVQAHNDRKFLLKILERWLKS